MTGSNDDDSSPGSEEDRSKKKASSLGTPAGLRLFSATDDSDSEDEDADNSPTLPSVANSSHLGNSLITQLPNNTTPRNVEHLSRHSSSPRRSIPEVTVPRRTSPRLASRSKSSSSSKSKKQTRVGESSLPAGLETLTQRSKEYFTLFTDDDGITFATKVRSPLDGKEYNLLTQDIKVSQLRKLASFLGVKNHHRQTKGVICQWIAEKLLDEDLMERAGTLPELNVARKTNSLCRLVNCLFSEKLFERFSRVNDLHTRIHHETGQTYKKFWTDVRQCYEQTDEDATDELCKIYGSDDADDDPNLKALSVQTHIDLNDFLRLTEEAIRKAVRDLVRVRAGIKDRMTQSGTHSNSAWDFVQASFKDLKDGGGSTMVTKDSAYYFYCRCNEHPDVDSQFQTFLDDDIKGSTEDLDSDDSSSITTNIVASGTERSREGSNKRRKKSPSLDDTSSTALMFQEMKRRNMKQELESEKLVETSVIMGLMKSVKTKLQIYMYQKNDEKIAECCQKLEEYEEQMKELQSKKPAVEANGVL